MTSTGTGSVVGVDFFDPHFHIWDVENIHSPLTLGGPAKAFPRYTLEQYESHMRAPEAITAGIHFVGGMFVEALPNDERGADELAWVSKEVAAYSSQQKEPNFSTANDAPQNETPAKRQPIYGLVGRVNLLHPSAEENLRRYQSMGVRAVRHIINHEPSWPFVSHDALKDEKWLTAFNTLLPKYGITVFDLHCNPHQLPSAVQVVAQHPTIIFVLNHLGCKRQADRFEEWKSAVEALASHPNSRVKLSHPCYTDPEGWAKKGTEVEPMLRVLLKAFGVRRCMVASNYPVSLVDGCPPGPWFHWLDTVVRPLAEEVEPNGFRQIMSLTAMETYGVHP
jgi:predicted TIM-barrel fold metal-dependent hydrolase